MIKRFRCHNFRNIQIDNMEFEKINILIGPNNSGKSNFIKAITFFSEMLKNANDGNLKSAFLNAVARNGWNHMVDQRQEGNVLDFSWEIQLGSESVRYDINFEVGTTIEDCNITMEKLNAAKPDKNHEQEFNYFHAHDVKIGTGEFSTAIQRGIKNKRLLFSIDPKETLIMQFKDILLKNKRLYGSEMVRVNIADLLYGLQKYFEGFSVYSSAQLDTNKMREPVNLKQFDEYLNKKGDNFVNVFNRYKSQDMMWKEKFEKNLRELIPELKMADVVIAYDKLLFKMRYENEEYDLSDISEGTLKGLIMNLIINMPLEEEISLLAIDEPETNMHPAWQKVIGKWVQTTNTFKQCFLSTHSPDFLDVFTDEFKQGNVAVFVFDNGVQTIKKIVYQDIADEMGEWELGDLYRTSDPALGGWPW